MENEYKQKDSADIVEFNRYKKWSVRIEKAGKDQKKKWEVRADKVVEVYRDERDSNVDCKKFNIFWSNVETIKPAVYSQTPAPQVSRRYKDSDPVAREASEVLERALEYSIDAFDFDEFMEQCVEDYLLPGRCIPKVHYEGFEGSEKLTEELSAVDYEEVSMRYYYWKDVRHGKARLWRDVPWVAYREYLTRDELIERFGDKGKLVKIEEAPKQSNILSSDDSGEERKDTAAVWEIWSKRDSKVCWIAEGCSHILDESEPPLNFKNFYPSPKPLFAVKTNDNLTPIPEYTLYQDQCKEIDDLTMRISLLVKSLKVAGVYNAEYHELQQLVSDGEENILIPVDSWAALAEKGGLRGAVEFMPIQEIATTAISLYEARDRTKQELYEITGISDIIRGSTVAQETATAQRLKGQWGSLRLQKRQKFIAKFARDCIAMMGEVIAEHFSPETLQLITNREISNEAIDLLRNDAWRSFRVDIETDSTIQPDEQADKEARIQFLEASSTYLERMLPAADAVPELGPFLGKVLMFAMRGFRVGRELEEEMEEMLDGLQNREPEPETPDPELIKAEQDAKKQEAQFMLEAEKLKLEREKFEFEREYKTAELMKGNDPIDPPTELEVAEQIALTRKLNAEAEAQELENQAVIEGILRLTNGEE